jgi:hypothetical protein
MPLQKLEFRPGLNREGTDYANEGGWFDGDKIRFRSGFPEKLGGWTQYATYQFIGTARSLWNWYNITGANYLGIGTTDKYYISNSIGGLYYDVTPIYETNAFPYPATSTNGFIATNNSAVITVADSSYTDASVGDYINISNSTGLGGNITGAVLNKEYVIASISGGTTYTIVAYSTQANAGSFVVGTQYTIQYLGSTNWNAAAGTTGVSYIIGSIFTAVTVGTGSGLAGVIVRANSSDTGNGGGISALLPVTIKYQYPIGLNTFTTSDGWGTGPWPDYNTVTLTNPFTAASIGTSTITITQAAHGLATGDFVYILSMSGTMCGIAAARVSPHAFQITNTGTNTYTINASFGNSTNITLSTAASGGTVVIEYKLTGDTRAWSTPFVTSTTTGVTQQLRIWSNDNYGTDLVIAPRGGPIFYWEAANGVSTRAVALSSIAGASDVPIATNQALAASIQQFIIALGADSYADVTPTFNPMLVRWSDQANQFNWTPAVTNQAGEFALSNGSYIVTGKTTRQEILVWTDSCLYSMQYLGAPYVWGFNVLMDNISIMSPSSAVTVNNVTYWMGVDKFYMYSGRVETLPCSLRQYVFNNINLDQNFQVFSGSNEGYNEVWWFYCSSNSNTIDKYVIYNYLDRVWYYGNMARTAWLDSGIIQNPVAADYNNRILNHEVGVDDAATATVQPINAYVQSSDFDIGDGHNFGFVWRILPDINFNGSIVTNPQVTMTVVPRQNSGSAYGTANNPSVISAGGSATTQGAPTPYSPTQQSYNIQQFTGQVYTRLRGRQLSFRIESTGQGIAWQLGCPRIDIRPDGRR